MPIPLGERVREQRRKRGLTIEGFAERVGSSKSYIGGRGGGRKQGGRPPSAKELAPIAACRKWIDFTDKRVRLWSSRVTATWE
ncbi:MAG: helix-turn-helix transcriptional regulator [Aestuariivita sp.]|nr:helix-turn-helix transcriptional regulator [Aestuariivita sp.]